MRALLAALALMAIASPAQAALKLCNRTSYILYAATSAVTSPGSVTKGWTRIVPGDCAVALPQQLTAQSYLVYARSSLAHSGPQRGWGGNFPVCVRDGDFILSQKVTQPYCTGADMFAMSFAPVDTNGRADWTMNFDEQPALTLGNAQLMGVKRLLQDNGYPIGALNALPDKPTGKSLAAFRAKMKFTDRDGNAELFTALENGARKNNAPAGYTVCNDSARDLLVAMGDKSGANPVARGWWTIAKGACARTITTPLAQDAVYLFAQARGGGTIVTGPEKFCIANGAFELASPCRGAGVTASGFAATVTKAKSGYVAHIGAKGLVAEKTAQAEISK